MMTRIQLGESRAASDEKEEDIVRPQQQHSIRLRRFRVRDTIISGA
jgi:hypothetical protein